MNLELQQKTPIMDALEAMRQARIVPFDVPGHKKGKGNPELTAFLGERTLSIDVNSMKPLDLLCHPVSVIKEAEEITADAFGASAAFLMVGGTSSSVIAMIMSACKAGDKILLPRNIHKSVISALILSGAVPVYIDPDIEPSLGISLGMRLADITRAIDDNPDACAILLNNPTYYGICSNLPAIVDLAHSRGMMVLVDEAHGTHFSFGEDLPISAIAAGADMASVSMHKSGGSLTQSSLLLLGERPNAAYVRQIINLHQTTSASYLLLVSLDISRKNLALRGREIFREVSGMAAYARDEINKIGGFHAFGREIVNNDSIFDFDLTKLSVNTLQTGLAGREVYDILRDDYDIQIEFGDIANFLAYISVGDKMKDIERLCSSLSEIYRIHKKHQIGMLNYEYTHPALACTPQEAFYSDTALVAMQNSVGRVSAELVMCYPPGVPIIAPGERITQPAVDYIAYARNVGCNLTGMQDEGAENIYVVR